MSINYHQKIFKPIANSDNGEVGEQTLFYYQQKKMLYGQNIAVEQLLKVFCWQKSSKMMH